jgi:hypothetical protein
MHEEGENDLLRAMPGTWSGTYRLWLEPGSPRSESPTTCDIRTLLDGRFLSLEYGWTDLDGHQNGVMLLGHVREGRWEMAWFDTWHTGGSFMTSVGEVPNNVRCTYGPDEKPWGWRTQFEAPSADELVITAWNVTPDGEEQLATEARYARGTSD